MTKKSLKTHLAKNVLICPNSLCILSQSYNLEEETRREKMLDLKMTDIIQHVPVLVNLNYNVLGLFFS